MLESYSCCKSEGGEIQSGKPDEAPTMVQEVSQDDGCGDAEKGASKGFQKSLMGASENGLQGVRRRKCMVSGRMTGQSLRGDAEGGADPGERMRSFEGSSRRWWKCVATARVGQEGAQPQGEQLEPYSFKTFV